MNGKELYDRYTSKRDYTGSKPDEYAQLLETIIFRKGILTFNLLEKAESEEKKLEVLDLTENGKILRDEIQVKDIVFV